MHNLALALHTTGVLGRLFAEAIENAIKIARSYTKRSGVIAFSGAFHGRSLFAVSLTGKVVPYKVGFGPFPPEIYHAPFPCHCADLAEVKKAVQHIFKADIEPSRVAAIVFEPVQGEGGFNVIQAEAVQWLRQLCDEHGIVMIADEIQTGFGRTGKMFAHEHSGIEADLITVAKSLAGGFPLSGVIGKAEIMDAPHVSGLGGTYGGNPVACAAALATIATIEADDLVARAAHIGNVMKERLGRLQADDDRIGDVRGRGAMIAVELVKSGTVDPDPELTKALCAAAHQAGVIVLSCGTFGNVLRFLPPLSISDELLLEGLEVLAALLADL